MKKNLLLGVALAAFTMAGLNGAKAEDTIAVIVKATTSEYWQWVFWKNSTLTQAMPASMRQAITSMSALAPCTWCCACNWRSAET